MSIRGINVRWNVWLGVLKRWWSWSRHKTGSWLDRSTKNWLVFPGTNKMNNLKNFCSFFIVQNNLLEDVPQDLIVFQTMSSINKSLLLYRLNKKSITTWTSSTYRLWRAGIPQMTLQISHGPGFRTTDLLIRQRLRGETKNKLDLLLRAHFRFGFNNLFSNN